MICQTRSRALGQQEQKLHLITVSIYIYTLRSEWHWSVMSSLRSIRLDFAIYVYVSRCIEWHGKSLLFIHFYCDKLNVNKLVYRDGIR